MINYTNMGLLPLEFSDCLTDSPYFRENLHVHEKELERTSSLIKNLIKEVKDLLYAAKNLSKAQRSLSETLKNFKFDCIGNSQTDDEIVIEKSLKQFGNLIAAIEEERERMLDRAYDQFIVPLENFRKEHIGNVKEGKKKFDKQTYKFYQSQERYLNLSTKKQDTVLQEADASVEFEQRHFFQASLEYVFFLQEVQERKKFEFVETLLGFIYGWLTFYHQGHEVAKDFKPYMTDLQIRLQRTRENFNFTHSKAEELMQKMLEVRQTKAIDSGSLNKMYARQGYLFLLEKKAFGTTWSKHYCQYQKENKVFTMIPYNPIAGKITNTETMVLKSCVRRMSDTIEKRFCFDITAEERTGVIYTLQALSEEDRKLWMDAMDGKEPTYVHPTKISKPEETYLDESGFNFINYCISVLENRGLEEQGLYRVVGVGSKVNKLLSMGLDRRKHDKLNLEDQYEWESKTLTSALKQYFRNLPEPLMTFRLHNSFIASAKLEEKTSRINDVHVLVHTLPKSNFEMLSILISHLSRVAFKSDRNLMSISNLGVCFGPTLLRPEEETMAAIMDIKFCNIVVEILIENCDLIFNSEPSTESATKCTTSDIQHTFQTSSKVSTNSHSLLTAQVPVPVTYAVVTSYDDGPKCVGDSSKMVDKSSYQPPFHHSVNTYSGHYQMASSESKNSFVDSRVNSQSYTSLPTLEKSNNHPYLVSDLRFHQFTSGADLRMPNQSQGNRNFSVYNCTNDNSQDSLKGHNSNSSSESLISHVSNKLSGISSSPIQTRNKLGLLYPPSYRPQELRVRTLFACVGENETELSFEPNQIITNVRPSLEPGWLQGTLNGRTGLIPENYVQYLP